MKSTRPVMRYWGAVGCTIRGRNAAAAADSLKALLDDTEPAVRIAAAEALVAVGEPQAGLQGLIDILGSTKDEMVALEALNVAAACKLTGSIPKPVYENACKTGNYPKNMLSDYPDNS